VNHSKKRGLEKSSFLLKMTYLNKIIKMVRAHKIKAGLALVIVVSVLYYGGEAIWGGDVSVRYAAATVERGTLISAIQGSGQVSATDQIDIKPRSSGEIIYVGVQVGQRVWIGQLIAQFDTRDALRSLEDAKINLEAAQIQLEKIQLNQTGDLDKIENSIETSKNNLIRAYEDGFSDISNTFLDLPTIISGLWNISRGKGLNPSSSSITSYSYLNMIDQRYVTDLNGYINSVENDYAAAHDAYEDNIDNFKNTSRFSEYEVIRDLIDETLETVRLMSQTAKSEKNLLDKIMDSRITRGSSIPSGITVYQNELASYINKLNGHISSLLNVQNSILNNTQNLENAERDLELTGLSNPLDVKSQKNTVKQREAAVASAQDNLANQYVRAPFTGILANVDVSRGDFVSSSTTIATIITDQRIAEVSLNEIDIAQIKIGQKATLIFDAIEDLTITGEVVKVDILGMVTQGVVNYGMKIVFDTQDERIRPGMSVSADIITNVSQDTLLIPNSAIKYQGDITYIEIIISPIEQGAATLLNLTVTDIQAKEVLIGNSNEMYTEILDGVEEGQKVVTQVVDTGSSMLQQGGGNMYRGSMRGTGGTMQIMPH